MLFADNTNIFVKAKNKALAYEKANTILKFVNMYMMTNKLHINMSKSCFIDFKSEKNSPLPNEELKVLIQNIKIERVTEAKFLGVTINENLKKLFKKLSCSTGILNTIKDNIPDDLHISLYHTLIESYLTYGITVWGGVTDNKLLPLLKLQKKWLRILVGDKEAYLDKFKVSARVRLFEEQNLGAEYFYREHTKPLFTKHSVMNVRNLFVYHCFNEIFKILKLSTQ